MLEDEKSFLPLFKENGELYGVFLSADLWDNILPLIRPYLQESLAKPQKEQAEPLEEWELLKSYWDFKYPVTCQISCSICGVSTENWETDEPKLFRLKLANMGGLVRFECCTCKSDITKRHFKSHIETICKACPQTEK